MATLRSLCPSSGKVIYPTKKAAAIALEDCQREGRDEQSFYPCDGCDGYHLSHYPEGYFIANDQHGQ